MTWNRTFVAALALCLAATVARATTIVIDFEDVALAANSAIYGGPSGRADGEPDTVLLSSGSASFRTTITRYPSGEFWSGFAFSNKGDTTTNSWTNDTSSFAGGGVGGTGNFAVAYWQSYDPPPLVTLPDGMRPLSLKLVNTTYAALTMRDGDPNNFSPGEYQTDDFLSVTFTGNSLADGTGTPTGTATFFLADFRNGNSLIIDQWTDFSLSTLGLARSISIDFASSDVGEYGINTPTYVALDNLTVTAVPEPSAIVLAACGAAAGLMVRRRKKAA